MQRSYQALNDLKKYFELKDLIGDNSNSGLLQKIGRAAVMHPHLFQIGTAISVALLFQLLTFVTIVTIRCAQKTAVMGLKGVQKTTIFAGQAILAGIKGVSSLVVKPFYWMKKASLKGYNQDFKKLEISLQEVKEFMAHVKEEVKNSSNKIFVVVRETRNLQGKTISTLVAELDLETRAQTVYLLSCKKWNLKEEESMQIFHGNKLLSRDVLLKKLQKNEYGVVELTIIKTESYG